MELFAGLAGSGKTTLMQRINSHLHQNKIPGYLLNLDPAVLEVPYGANIDIRDTVSLHMNLDCEYHIVLIDCSLFLAQKVHIKTFLSRSM